MEITPNGLEPVLKAVWHLPARRGGRLAGTQPPRGEDATGRMDQCSIKEPRSGTWPYALLCAVMWLFIGLGIGPAQLYHHQTPVFMSGIDSLVEGCSSVAGGMTEYLGAALTQTFHRPWLGALILALLLGCIAMLSNRWLTGVTGRPHLFAGIVPVVLLLTLLSGWALPVASMVGMALALLAGVLFSAAVKKVTWAAFATFALLTLALYPATAGPYLFFAALALLHAVMRRRFLLAALYGLSAVTIPYLVGIRLWHCGAREAYLGNLLFEYDHNPQILSTATYAAYPLILVWAVMVAWRGRRNAELPAIHSPRMAFARAAALVVWAVACGLATHDARLGTILRVDRHARDREWEQALSAAASLRWSSNTTVGQLKDLVYLPYLSPRFPRTAQQSVPLRLSYESLLHNVNLALQRQGRLLDELFCYPQVMGMSAVRMLPDNVGPYVAHSYNIDVLLHLGHINEAERVACEVLANIGPRPWLLERLAMIYALKDQPATAAVFVASLARQPAHRDQANRWREALTADPGLKNDILASEIRPYMYREDFVGSYIGSHPDEEMLLRLLHNNPHNRVAFDFLMAHYLLNLRHDQILRRVPVLGEFGYDRMPRHMEEAVLMHAKLTGDRLDLRDRQISSATLQRFQRFDQMIERMGGLSGKDPRPVRDTLRPEFADTYWFYCLFGNTFFEVESEQRLKEGTP